jgi:hypothetical protein
MRHAPASNQRHVELPNFLKMCPILAERGLLPVSPCERQGRKPPPTGARKQAIHYGPAEDRRASCLSLYRDIGHRANCRRPLLAPRTRKRAIDLLLAASRLRHRPYRALHSLMPPFRLMNSGSCSRAFFWSSAYRSTLLHLLRERLSTLAGSAVHRMTASQVQSKRMG